MKRILITVCLLCLVPAAADARHGSRIDTSDLDDDIVEELPVPVLFGVGVDDITPDFGDPRGGGAREHEGQDLRAPQGTPIVSPTEAIVLRTGEGRSSGKYVYTANPGGEVFRYMHLDEIADLDRGDALDVGDLIGTVGDTGNAPDGVYHLHLEIRDEENEPTDPYPRLTESFSVKEQMRSLRRFWNDVDEFTDADDYAAFLVETFPQSFAAAVEEDLVVPDEIEDALAESGAHKKQKLLAQLNDIIDRIPTLLQMELSPGDSGGAVSLLQTYLIFRSDGPARDRLAGAGATGYYGPITAAAVTEFQDENDAMESGTYTEATREVMLAK